MFYVIALAVIFVVGIFIGFIRCIKKYTFRIFTEMPVMQWIPYHEISFRYFDNADFWTRLILDALYRRNFIECRIMEGFECAFDITNRTFTSSDIEVCEFRLRFRPRKKKYTFNIVPLGA